MPTDQLVQRLEAVVARLEHFADSAGAKSTGAASAAAAGAGSSAALTAFDEFMAKSVAPFVAAAKKFKETVKVAEMTETVMAKIHDVIAAAASCKKPSPQELGAFVEPISKVMSDAEKLPDKRNAQWFPFHKAFAEAVPAFTWIMAPAPKAVIEAGIEPADFHLNSILTAAKKLSGEEQANYRAYVSTLKAMLNQMLAYAVENFKMGIDWNPKGGALSAFAGGSSSIPGGADVPAAPEAPEAPADLPPPAPSDLPTSAPSGGAGGMSAVFGQLNSLGEGGVTAGLKKVTKDMKTKNLKDQPVLQPKEKKAAEKKTEKKEVKKEPKLELKQGTWFCENYEDQADMTIPDVQMKENVYISHCKKCTIRIPDKAKSIQVDSCQKVVVIFKSVVSTFEVVNSSSVTADCQEQCPSFALDKSQGVQVIMSAAVVAQAPAPPDIVSSNITACNIVVPGKTEKDDPIEIPLPEQYMTKYDPKTFKCSTEPIKHSGG